MHTNRAIVFNGVLILLTSAVDLSAERRFTEYQVAGPDVAILRIIENKHNQLVAIATGNGNIELKQWPSFKAAGRVSVPLTGVSNVDAIHDDSDFVPEDLRFSRDGSWLACVVEGRCCFWEASSPAQRFELVFPFPSLPASTIAPEYFPKSFVVGSCIQVGTIDLAAIPTFIGSYTTIGMLKSKRLEPTGIEAVANKVSVAHTPSQFTHPQCVRIVRLTDDSRRLIAASAKVIDTDISVLEARSLAPLQTWRLPNGTVEEILLCRGGSWCVSSTRVIAAPSENLRIKQYNYVIQLNDVSSGEQKWRSNIKERIAGIVSSPTWDYLIAITHAGTLLRYRLFDGAVVGTHGTGISAINCACIDSSGRRLLLGRADGIVTIIDDP